MPAVRVFAEVFADEEGVVGVSVLAMVGGETWRDHSGEGSVPGRHVGLGCT